MTKPPSHLPVTTYLDLRHLVETSQFARDISWSENIKEARDAEHFAGEAVWVIINSGMKHTVARLIHDRVERAICEGRPVIEAFRHPGKAAAIEHIIDNRYALFADFLAAAERDRGDPKAPHVLAFCQSLPWIGGITKFHLAKNLGVDCAKPDVWLVRLAKVTGEDPHELCARLARESGDRIATVDLVLWRCMARGWLKLDLEARTYWINRASDEDGE